MYDLSRRSVISMDKRLAFVGWSGRAARSESETKDNCCSDDMKWHDLPMISIVIPTLQQSAFLGDLIDLLQSSDLVSEIVLINNSQAPILHASAKLRIHNPGENLFVNPSWNLGMELAQESTIGILNDDILFPVEVLDRIVRRVNRGAGLVGPATSCFRPPSGRFTMSVAYHRPKGFGVAMFFDRSHYFPIPPELKIWAGDDFLFNRQTTRNYQFSGVEIRGVAHSTAGQPRFDEQKQRDTELYECKYATSTYNDKFRFERRVRMRLGLSV